jgi:glycosyltransferase involved in cell wall biosynthesis
MFTIITPTYNREDLVQITIRSILAQTFQDWELIIVDDGSTDNTEKVLQPYLSDKRIRYIKKANSGQAQSLNLGIQYVNGDFITFLDSDDEAYPNWLSTVRANIQADTGAVCVAAIRKLADGTMLDEHLKEYKLFGETMLLKFTCGSLFVRKDALKAIGCYDAELRSNIQTDLGYRLISYLRDVRLKVVTLNDHLVQINIHNGERVRTNWRKMRDGGVQFLNKHYQFIYNNNRKEIADICSTIAFSNYKLLNRSQSVRYLLKAIRHNPKRVINYFRIFKYAFI